MHYLWVPPSATRIRGIIIVGGLVTRRWIEYPFLKDTAVNQSLALVYATEGCLKDWHFLEDSTYKNLTAALAHFAAVTGMPDLTTAPFFTIGCSTMGPWSNQFCAFSNPERCFGFGAFSEYVAATMVLFSV